MEEKQTPEPIEIPEDIAAQINGMVMQVTAFIDGVRAAHRVPRDWQPTDGYRRFVPPGSQQPRVLPPELQQQTG